MEFRRDELIKLLNEIKFIEEFLFFESEKIKKEKLQSQYKKIAPLIIKPAEDTSLTDKIELFTACSVAFSCIESKYQSAKQAAEKVLRLSQKYPAPWVILAKIHLSERNPMVYNDIDQGIKSYENLSKSISDDEDISPILFDPLNLFELLIMKSQALRYIPSPCPSQESPLSLSLSEAKKATLLMPKDGRGYYQQALALTFQIINNPTHASTVSIKKKAISLYSIAEHCFGTMEMLLCPCTILKKSSSEERETDTKCDCHVLYPDMYYNRGVLHHFTLELSKAYYDFQRAYEIDRSFETAKNAAVGLLESMKHFKALMTVPLVSSHIPKAKTFKLKKKVKHEVSSIIALKHGANIGDRIRLRTLQTKPSNIPSLTACVDCSGKICVFVQWGGNITPAGKDIVISNPIFTPLEFHTEKISVKGILGVIGRDSE
ncbi:hypothetical protein ADUPG1_009670 [Aduncisulcus paluster]|uniref:Tetratricopeptide repeat protein 5 OB fold domain-containing protein n=1 Tax=Aduncisulcus paluster TaxID=2918883 RepID=A0ABQ5KXJ3_9EUKA|nr:hypothetical protein ADUPG1_009670 [Aduncisulcus paluster]